MIGTLRRMLIGLLSSLSGIGAASIGGLPGAPKGKKEEDTTVWVDWGGSQLRIPEVRHSQQAFEQGAYDQAYKSLSRVRRSVEQGSTRVKSPTFRAQLDNNLAVSAHNSSQHARDASKRQRLQHVAQYHITHAAQRPTSSLELSNAITRNVSVIVRKR